MNPLRWLVHWLMPTDVRDAVLADLDAEYLTSIRPARGQLAARWWYWRQLAGSVAPALAMRRRRRMHSGKSMRNSLHHMWAEARQDLRFAGRMLARNRTFSAAAIGTFAVGIGLTTAVFSLVDAILLRPLPYAEPLRLVRIWSANPRGIPRNMMSPADFFDLRDAASGFDALAAFTTGETFTVSSGGDATRIAGSTVTPALFDLLGVRPLAGRTLQPSDAAGSGSREATISEGLWRERFGADPSLVGRAIVLDGSPHTVVGIMPASFEFPGRGVHVWVPLVDARRNDSRSAHYLEAVGKLSTGTNVAAGRAVLEAGALRLAEAYPDTNRGWGVTVTTLRDSAVSDVRTPLLMLFSAVTCVLLIACANVAGLLLARGVTRTREMAVRAALGASAARRVRQQLVECGLLAMAGGLAGIALAAWSLDALQAAEHLSLPWRGAVTLDTRVLSMAFATSIAAGLIAGLVPALRTARAHEHALRAGARSTVGHVRLRNAIVLVQVAVVMVLVVAGALLLRSLQRVTTVDAGFRADQTLLADVSLPTARYPREARATLFSRALDGIRALPGVEVAGAGGPLPLAGRDGLLRFGLLIDGQPQPPDRSDRGYLRWVTPGYFEAMGIPLRAGRLFAERDAAGAPLVAVVDEVLAARFFPGRDPIGSRVRTTNDQNWRPSLAPSDRCTRRHWKGTRLRMSTWRRRRCRHPP
jgi:predicted permease